MNSGIYHRISVRKFEDKPVEKDLILDILRAGMRAPSACNQQPWEFYVVTDRDKIKALSKVSPYAGCAAGGCGCRNRVQMKMKMKRRLNGC